MKKVKTYTTTTKETQTNTENKIITPSRSYLKINNGENRMTYACQILRTKIIILNIL